MTASGPAPTRSVTADATGAAAPAPKTRATVLTAVEKRAAQPLLATMWSPTALAPQLPLRFPVDPTLPASPKTRYRSAYQPPDPLAGPDPAQWADLTDFEVALHLIDFSGLERALATAYVASAKGQVPFHPVSLFLCLCLRREQQLSWRALARLLHHDQHGAGWRAHFGFADGVTPSASGLRHFQNAVGAACFADLCPQFIRLLRQHGLAPEQSTYPGIPPHGGLPSVRTACSTSPAIAPAATSRPLPASSPWPTSGPRRSLRLPGHPTRRRPGPPLLHPTREPRTRPRL